MFCRFLALSILVFLLCPAPCSARQKTDSDTIDGSQLFARHCAGCHGSQGKGTSIAPSLQTAMDPQLVELRIRTGKGIMPPFGKKLSPHQIHALAKYVTMKLAGISLPSGHLSHGGILFRVNCAPCHRTAVRGGALIFTTKSGAPALTDVSAKTIITAIRMGPGPMPPFPPTVFNNHDLASIVRYVQFVQNPPHPGGLSLGYYGPVAEGFVTFIVVVFLVLVCAWIEKRGRG